MDEETELRNYRYELQGYIVIENVLTPGQIATLNALLDERLPPLPDDWRKHFESAAGRPYANYRFGMAGGSHGTNPGFLAWGQAFVDLMDHPVTMEVMRHQLGDCFRLDRIFGMRMRRGMPSGVLHSDYGASEPYTRATPGQYHPQPAYQALHGFGVAAFNLTDSGPDTGGLCCIPGSHNCRVKLPERIRGGDHQDLVRVPKAPAGSVTFFSEATTHGTMAWTGAHERRTLLYKYCASQLSWSRARVTPPENIELTERQKLLLAEPAGAHWFFPSLF